MSNKDVPNTDFVRELAELLSKSDLSEIEVEKGDLRVRVARQLTAAPMQTLYAAAPAPAAAALIAPSAGPAPPAGMPEGTLKSPMVGTVFRRPSPEAKPLVEIGARVKAGERVLLIEAMKTFNDVVAPRAGVVTQIFVEDAQPVEFGQPLLVIE